ncbi:uncharacterized protein C2845_PM07G27980 [Panicum miliaceum]|uniref:Uncharacterized protein n=1 Tax=Panicum miliaceum TaxID=4540 RepID=A0A3L6SJ46_PANMI|nr:uncharacterized protein C2845_PM07G27980 [Panicum miliaceum]
MDAKKKRNKKKGNQGENTTDVTSNAGEAAPQNHNHESAPRDHYKGSDADDAMSSVGEGVPQYQNHEPTLPLDHNGSTNAHDTTSPIGEGISCYQNNEPTLTQNHKASNAVPADQRMSHRGMSLPLDDIQIHEDDPRQPEADDEIDEVPFSDAPIIGAPFRLISFVARYVSGADLVNQK